MQDTKNDRKSSFTVLKGISAAMCTKLATAGLTLKHLEDVFEKGGADGISFFLSESVDGQVRVTSSQSIIKKIISELQRLKNQGKDKCKNKCKNTHMLILDYLILN